MPYENEFANPYGYGDLVNDPFIMERIETFNFNPTYEKGESPVDFLKIASVDDLPDPSVDLDSISSVVAVDGSIVKPSEDEGESYDLAVLKIGMAEQDLRNFMLSKDLNTPMTPTLWNSVYSNKSLMAILSGKGIYGQGSVKWMDKAKEELYSNLKNMTVPGSSSNLFDVLRTIIPRTKTVPCPACAERGVATAIDFSMFPSGVGECLSCGEEPIYYSDFLLDTFSESFFQPMMLLFEKLLMSGLIDANGDRQKMFILDGPLALYGRFNLFNGYFLDHIQGKKKPPLFFSIEKTGVTNDFAKSGDVQKVLMAGQVAMITTESAQSLEGKVRTDPHSQQYFYGKRFIYRTLDGKKTFVFMVPPLKGSPYRLNDVDFHSESWDNYPNLKLYCQYMENTYTSRFGTETAALDVISEANYAASLPKTLSMKFLNDMLKQNLNG